MPFGIADRAEDQNFITQSDLVDLILNIEQNHRGTNFFGVSQVTKENTRKAPFPVFTLSGLKHGKTYFAKVSQVNGEIGFNYPNAVNKQREAEGKPADFIAKRSIYDKIEGSNALLQKDGQIYLRYMPIGVSRRFSPTTVVATNSQATQFEKVSSDVVAPYKYANKTGHYQGLTKGVEIRIIVISSIAAIKIGGKEYVISDLDSMRKAIYTAADAPKPLVEGPDQ